MSDYRDKTIDLVNAAKSENDSKKVDILLHQIKEISLHRDKTVLPYVIKDVMDLAIGAKTNIVLLLVSFAGEALRIDFSLLHVVLASFNFLLSVESDKVHRAICSEISSIYGRAAMHIAELIGSQNENEASIRQMWKHLCGITDKLIDKISSSRAPRASERLRSSGVVLAESVILFGLPAPQQKADPRRRRVAGPSATEGSASIANLTSMHPFIVDIKDEREKEAEDVYAKFVLWAQQGGPAGFPFTPEQMSLLGQILSKVAGLRQVKVDGSDSADPRCSRATKALEELLHGKKSVCKQMGGASRKELVLAMHRFVGTSPPDPKGYIPKLREAIAEIEKLGFADEPIVEEVKKEKGPAKRGHAEMAEEEDAEPSVEDQEAARAAALAALDSFESVMKRKRTEEHAVQASGGSSASGGGADTVQQTELASDLAGEPNDSSIVIAKVSSKQSASGGTGVEYSLVPVSVNSEQVGLLAAAALQRLLESFYISKAEGPIAASSHARMSVRTALSQTSVEMREGIAPVAVQMFSFLPAEIDVSLLDGVPRDVALPRPLWQLLGFVLGPSKEDPKTNLRQKQASLLLSVREKIGLLVMMLKELAQEAQSGVQAAGEVYDRLAMVTMGRMLQNVHLRELTKPFFAAMPRVPSACISLLHLLLFTGTKPRGTRQEALTMLGALIFSRDQEAGQAALNRLLWCAVHADFEVRSKAVALLVDLMQKEDWLYESVSVFALHAAAQLVGVDAVLARSAQVTLARTLSWGALATEAAAKAADAGKNIAALTANTAGAAEIDADMQIESGEAQTGAPQTAAFAPQGHSIVETLESYDDGMSYGGCFSSTLFYPLSAVDDVAGVAAVDAFVSRSVHLLAQICALDPGLLGAFVDVTAAASAVAGVGTLDEATAAAKAAVTNAASRQAAKLNEGGAAAAAAAAAATELPVFTGKSLDAHGRFERVYCTLRTELGNILPAVVVRHPTEKIFEALARSDPLGRPILTYAMEVLHNDTYMPSTPECISAAVGYLKATSAAAAASVGGEAGAGTAAAPLAKGKTATEEATFLRDLPEAELRFCFPILGGFSRSAVEGVLARILRMLQPTPDTLNRIVTRITQVRPPVFTKAELLVWLHRLEPAASGLDLTQIKDLLGVLLEREDFDAEAIRETLSHLVEDTVPCLNLMRTGIMSAMKHKDVRKYMLTDTVPKLIRRRVWDIKDEASGKPRVWEGVIHFIGRFFDQKDAEQTLRCVLCLDGPRLEMVLKMCPKLPPALAKLLKTLGASEKEDIFSGRWAGIGQSHGQGYGADKKAIIDNLLAMKL